MQPVHRSTNFYGYAEPVEVAPQPDSLRTSPVPVAIDSPLLPVSAGQSASPTCYLSAASSSAHTMSKGFSGVKLFAGSSHTELAQLVSRRMGIPLSASNCKRTASGEISLDIQESIREADVYIIKCVSASNSASVKPHILKKCLCG